MAERQQQNGRNCIFRALSEAAGMRLGHQKDLQRRVVKRVRAESGHDIFEEWSTSKVLVVAAEEMQMS